MYALSYGSLKLVNYGIMYWLPTYLQDDLDLSEVG